MGSNSTSGRSSRVADEELLAVLRATDDPVLSTAEVAAELPIKRRATLTRLHTLADAGRISYKKTGGRNLVWWLTDNTGQNKTTVSDTEHERWIAPDDPFFTPTTWGSGGPTDVSENVDAYLVAAIENDSDDDQ